ncbi:WD40 repeat protein [Deinococcus metalli]|uniref:WD40 repeat protein n=1 Tax=Deinococcus metalli TaxID=1141878 RepID=A0A7W8NQ58_9DEIO|nr:PQQ-binding-like beta-propeller repeat protein [Deinococcus metalli]MBB5374797.1 WD40 repeat protein [Deinococcus metalli]
MTITLFDRMWELMGKECPGKLPKEHPVRLDHLGPDGSWLVVSPDGDWLAIVEKENQIRVLDIRTGRTRWCAHHHQDPVLRLAWSPDSQTLLTSSEEGHITMLQASSGAVIWTYHAGDWAGGLDFSPDGGWIAVGTHAETLLVLSVADGEELWRADLGCAVYSTAWSADGALIAAAGDHNLVAIVRSGGGSVIWRLPISRQFYTWDTVRWHPTAPRLAALRYNGSELIVFDARTEQQVFRVAGTDVRMVGVGGRRTPRRTGHGGQPSVSIAAVGSTPLSNHSCSTARCSPSRHLHRSDGTPEDRVAGQRHPPADAVWRDRPYPVHAPTARGHRAGGHH